MEPYIINKVSDITYMSELTPTASLCEAKRWGSIHTATYVLLVFRKLRAH
jgi:hypothetical protein